MIHLYLFSIGLVLAFLLDAVWRIRFWGKDRGKLRVLEHYHWGLLIMILSKTLENTFLLGLGVGLIISEELQKHPFGLNSDHFKQSTILGITLLILLTLFSLLS